MKIKQHTLQLLLAVLFAASGAKAQSDPGSIKSKCDQEISAINDKMIQGNADWEQTKKDLRAGLFCSLCGYSKTELDRTYPGGFYAHLTAVNGKPVPATQAQTDAAYKRYMDKYNSLKNQYEDKQKSCQESYNNAVAEQQKEQQQAAQALLQKQQDAARQQQQAQQQAQLKAQQDEQKREDAQRLAQQKAAEAQQKAQQDAIARQQAAAEQKKQYDQSIINQSEQNKKEMTSQMQQQGDQTRSDIQEMKGRLDNMGTVSFGGTPTVNPGYNANLANTKGVSADDYTPEQTEEERWHAQTMEILERSNGLIETQAEESAPVDKCNDCFAGTSYDKGEIKKAVSDYINESMKDYVKESAQDAVKDYLSDKFPAVKTWYETYDNNSPMIGYITTNAANAYDMGNKAIAVLNTSFEGSEENTEAAFQQYQQDMVYALPGVGPLAKGYTKLKNFYDKYTPWKAR